MIRNVGDGCLTVVVLGRVECVQGCRSLLSIGGMNLDNDLFQVSKLSEDQNKKKVFTKNGTVFSPNTGEDQKKQRSSPTMEQFFPQIQVKTKKKVFIKNGALISPNSSGDLRSDVHRSQIVGGDADVDHTQIIRGIQSNYWRGYIPHPPRFRHL